MTAASAPHDPIRAIFVDDDPSDIKLADRLSRGGLECVGLVPPDSLDELVEVLTERLKSGRNLVLLDYRLDTQSSASHADYRGGSVAAAVKERFPLCPVVLVTTEQKFQRSVAHNPSVRAVFDHQILKDDLHRPSQRSRIATDLLDLAHGYLSVKSLADGTRPSWDAIANLLKADEQEVSLLPEYWLGAAPAPAQVEICRWLLQELLLYTGPFLDRYQTAARLGLTQSSFDRVEIQTALAPAEYRGPFSQLRPRWWRGRIARLLRRWAKDDADSSSERRTKALARELKVARLLGAKCVWCGSGAVQRACSICNQSVDAPHAIVGYIDSRPRWAESAAICFDCIEKGKAKDVRFEAGSGGLVREIQKGKVSREPFGS